MPDKLETIIKTYIALHGPMPVDQYWTLCLAHPEHGYYIKQDPLGSAGDFTTAPEISQLFGEMIGIWAAEQWRSIGAPDKIHLVECGPGRGTLMADLLRIANMIPEFAAALHIHLVETSPALREKQKQALGGWVITWHDDLDGLPQDAPILIIGNEFLDALPIKQYVKANGKWHERCIAAAHDRLEYVLGGQMHATDFPEAGEGQIYEISPVRNAVFNRMLDQIKNRSGAILMVDYGHLISAAGDTFQAVKTYQFVNPLEHQGDADLTSHVDFGKLAGLAAGRKFSVRMSTQCEFLEQTGIRARADQIKKKATELQIKDIDAALHRLLDVSRMGALFKVMEVSA